MVVSGDNSLFLLPAINSHSVKHISLVPLSISLRSYFSIKMPQARVFVGRSNKESFRRRRKAVLNSAENILQEGAQVYVIVRQSNSYYVYNSESSLAWLAPGQKRVRNHPASCIDSG